MVLDKSDFKQIEKIVNGSELRIKTELRKEIKETVDGSENRIIAVLSREITDLAEINRVVIQRVDKIAELEKRIIHIEHKIGIVS